jgi:hypothetical protein
LESQCFDGISDTSFFYRPFRQVPEGDCLSCNAGNKKRSYRLPVQRQRALGATQLSFFGQPSVSRMNAKPYVRPPATPTIVPDGRKLADSVQV